MLAASGLQDLTMAAQQAYAQYHTQPGIGEQAATGGVLLYPNPSNGVVTIRIHGAVPEKVNFSLTDLAGRVVLSKVYAVEEGKYSFTADLSGISPAMYIWKLTSGRGVSCGRISVTR